MEAKRREYRIAEMVEITGLSADTLRYYERIGLLPQVARSASGARRYGDADLSLLRFIQRGKSMNFSLEEIAQLVRMRRDPQHAADEVRALTRRKLCQIEAQLQNLQTLRDELRLLINLCQGSVDGCPIIDGMDGRGSE